MRPEDIAWSPDALGRRGGPDDVRVRWLGTAGFAIEHAGHVDPHRPVRDARVARPVRRRAAAARTCRAIRRTRPRPTPSSSGTRTSITLLDVPDIAVLDRRARASARARRRRSAGRAGVPPRRVEVVEPEAGQAAHRARGRARSTCASSRAPTRASLLGRVPFARRDRRLRRRADARRGVPVRRGLRRRDPRGRAHALSPGQRRARRRATSHVKHVDLLLLCVAGWTASARRCPSASRTCLRPGAVLLSHWDDFLRPLDQPVRALPAMQLPRLVERLGFAARA